MPDLHVYLGNNAAGLANLALLILFFASLWKTFKPKKSTEELSHDIASYTPRRRIAKKEATQERWERRAIRKVGTRGVKKELHSVDIIRESVSEMIRVIEKDPTGLSSEDRQSISSQLLTLSGKEGDFRRRLSEIKNWPGKPVGQIPCCCEKE